MKIYPLAKIVCVAHAFATLMIQEKISPIDALKIFTTDRLSIVKYDPACIRSLIIGFIDKNNSRERIAL